MEKHKEPPRFDREFNLAFSDQKRSDMAVLLGLCLVASVFFWIALEVRGEDFEGATPRPEELAACKEWNDYRTKTADVDGPEKLERMPDLAALANRSTIDPMIQQARAELADGGDHFQNYAVQIDARCQELLERAGVAGP